VFSAKDLKHGLVFSLAAAMVCSPGIESIRGAPQFTDESSTAVPFGLPFEDPPGPSSWLLIQPFGNTVFAYRNRWDAYGAGQGLHFGIDFAARCGTPVLAIGDGIVKGVDVAYHGAGPHNLLIDHQNGYVSLYGHLLAKPLLERNQFVKQGEVVARVGDPDETCTSRPHLHLEIRDSKSRSIGYNPIELIEADWHRIALVGSTPIRFQQDLKDPRRWQDLLDQPEVKFGNPLINNYEQPWPFNW
jgi:murein DD-endopeptidase MepM/ murein hydrolase activator NlpD